jgi:archaeal flagellar protein FlaI
MGAGLLSFFIDSQCTLLVTGSRGSGKTSLMGALMLEILQNQRVLCIEDTLELPVAYMKEIGFNVQSLKTSAPVGGSSESGEVTPADALRTALRLGDSALVVGEVRSTEAKVLFEAMRVGAAGSIVMGTIHGDSAYSVWDRVVNDLDVPTTSFKATDAVVVARPIRFSGSLKRHRRVTQVTEVKKHWLGDPSQEGGLLDLMSYNAKKDSLNLIEDNLKESDLFSKVSDLTGLSLENIWNNIRMSASSKEFLVDLKNEFGLPRLLEAENTVPIGNKLLLLKERCLEENGAVDYDKVFSDWKNWVKDFHVKRLVSLKKKEGAKRG